MVRAIECGALISSLVVCVSCHRNAFRHHVFDAFILYHCTVTSVWTFTDT